MERKCLILLGAVIWLFLPALSHAYSPPPNCPTSGGTQALNYSTAINAFSCNPVSGSGVTWPTTGSVVISNGTSTPAGVAEVDGSCLKGVSGSWATGSCGSGGGVSSFTGDSVLYSNSASTGSVTLSPINENANTVFAGPTSGSAAAPGFRALVNTDLPKNQQEESAAFMRTFQFGGFASPEQASRFNMQARLNAAERQSGLFLGYQAAPNVSGTNNTVLGYQAGQKLTSGTNNVLIGTNAGNNLTASGSAVIIGNGANTVAGVNNAVVIGSGATGNSVTIGQGANDHGVNTATVVGMSANVTGNNGVALGNGAAAANGSIALGTGSTANGASSISILATNASTASLLDIGVIFQADMTNNAKTLFLQGTSSGVDWVQVQGAATANPATVTVSAQGSDSNINLNLVSKGTGTIQCNGSSCGSGTSAFVTSMTASMAMASFSGL
jgi:hypothetical protein